MAFTSTLTNAATAKSNVISYVIINGARVFTLDSDPTNSDAEIYAIKDDIGNPVFESKAGYTEKLEYDTLLNKNSLPSINIELDFSEYINAGIETWAIEDGATEQVYIQKINDVLIRPYVYKSEITDVNCFNKTILAFYSAYILRDSSGQYLKDSNGYYLVSLVDINDNI